MALMLPKSKKKKAAAVQAKKDSTARVHDKRMFEFYSDPEKACKHLKGSRKSVEECKAFAKKFTKDYLAREYPEDYSGVKNTEKPKKEKK